jgi:hypothetical protein
VVVVRGFSSDLRVDTSSAFFVVVGFIADFLRVGVIDGVFLVVGGDFVAGSIVRAGGTTLAAGSVTVTRAANRYSAARA